MKTTAQKNKVLLDAMCIEYNPCGICRFRLVQRHTQFPCTQCKFGVKNGMYLKWQKMISDKDCATIQQVIKEG